MSAYGPVVDIKVVRETVSHHQVYEKRVFWWNRQYRQVGIVVHDFRDGKLGSPQRAHRHDRRAVQSKARSQTIAVKAKLQRRFPRHKASNGAKIRFLSERGATE
jgi:hypothetical protein